MYADFTEFGKIKEEGASAESSKAQSQVKKLQDFITRNFYQCSDEILHGLGQMYAGGGEFTQNIDAAGGAGTAEFAASAISVYCERA